MLIWSTKRFHGQWRIYIDKFPMPRSWRNFLHFHAVFRKFWPNNKFPPSPCSLCLFWKILDQPLMKALIKTPQRPLLGSCRIMIYLVPVLMLNWELGSYFDDDSDLKNFQKLPITTPNPTSPLVKVWQPKYYLSSTLCPPSFEKMLRYNSQIPYHNNLTIYFLCPKGDTLSKWGGISRILPPWGEHEVKMLMFPSPSEVLVTDGWN